MAIEVNFNLSFPDAPPPWVAPLIESVLVSLFNAPVPDFAINFNLGGVPTPAQQAQLQALVDRVNKIDPPRP